MPFFLFACSNLLEADGGLPDKSQQEEEQGNDRQNIDQGIENLVSFGQFCQ